MAGIAGSRPWVSVGSLLSCSGASLGLTGRNGVSTKSSRACQNAHSLLFPNKLLPREVKSPEQSGALEAVFPAPPCRRETAPRRLR